MQPETLEHSTGDSSLSSALHFLNEIPLPLSQRGEGGREGGGVELQPKKTGFFFPLQSVRGLKGGALEAERELVGAHTEKKFVCLLDILFYSKQCTGGGGL